MVIRHGNDLPGTGFIILGTKFNVETVFVNDLISA